MAAINAAYRLLSDPRQRAAYDARRYLPRTSYPQRTVPPTVRVAYPAPPPPASPPTPLQRRVDRVVAVIGVVLLIAIGFYTINVIPFAEQQREAQRRSVSIPPRPTDASAPALTATAPASANGETGDHLAGATIADRVRSDAGLRSFPGTVLVPPLSLPPFSSLPVQRVEANGQGIARYAVYYGDFLTGGASIAGTLGQSLFDNSAPRLPDCAADATYCAGPIPGQTSGPPALELFRGDDVISSYPAFVTHRINNGGSWWVYWYEPRANMSYTLELQRSVAMRFGDGNIEGDRVAAHAVAALAAQLVRLT